MATFITVEQEGSELLRRNKEQTQANRLNKVEGDEQRRTEQQAREARQQQLQQQGRDTSGNVVGDGRRRRFRMDEPAATFVPQTADLFLFSLRWLTGADYDLNVGFAQTLQNPGGFRPAGGGKLPEFTDYVGWTFEQYEAHNFLFHYGDNTEEGETGEGYEYVVVDLTTERTDMPEWVLNSITLELRSYWYREKSNSPLQLLIYPIQLKGQPGFDPLEFETEIDRLALLGEPLKTEILFSTNVGTDANGGDLGDLIATIQIRFFNKTWNLTRYK